MAELTIDLREGFSGDTVTIAVNGNQVWRRENVSTDYSIGLAASFQTEVETGSLEIQIDVETRELAETFETDLSQALFVAAAVGEDGRLRISASRERPRYL